MLIPEISNYNSNDEKWKAEDQWVCNKWTRGTLLQLKDDKKSGLFGLVRLLTCIQDLYKNNDEYKQRLPESFKNNDNLKNLFKKLKENILKKEWNGKKFANDDKNGPLRCPKNKNKDMILEIFEKPLIDSLKQLHENKTSINANLNYAKKILNYVCEYDYSADNDQIVTGVFERMESESLLFKTVSFLSFLGIDSIVKNIITMSLPDKKFLDDL